MKSSELLKVSIDVSSVPMRPAGAGRYAIELASGLVERAVNEEIYLVTTRASKRYWQDIAPGSHLIPTVPSQRPLRLLYEQIGMGRDLRRSGIGLHHGIHYTMPRRFAGPRVVTIHDTTLIEHPEWHERSKVVFFGEAIRAAAKYADALICPSHATAARVMELLEPRADVFVVYHGVDTDWLSVPDVPLPPGVGPRYLLFVGTLEPRKDLPTLVEAFSQVGREDPDLRLVIAGQVGWMAEESLAAIQRSRFSERIVRLDYVDDSTLSTLYRNASAFVYPSLYEGFGLPVIEAMAAGIPVVTTRDSVMVEVSRGNVVQAEPSDPTSLSQGIRRVLAGGPEIGRKVQLARATAASYTWEASVEAHLAIYRNVASG